MIAYFEEFLGSRFAAGVGWFQAFIYMPTITVIVARVAGIYTLELFPLPIAQERTLLLQIVIGLGYMLIL